MTHLIDNIEALRQRDILVFDHFLKPTECKVILNELDDDLWMRSKIAVQHSYLCYAQHVSDQRTNQVYYDLLFTESLKKKIEAFKKTLQGITNMPGKNFENWQLCRFKQEEKFDFHNDSGSWNGHPSGDRKKTVLIYLQAPASGGETYFRALNLYIRPIPGRLVIWNNLLQNGEPNYEMIHASLPVKEGTKITLNTWIREEQFLQSAGKR